jgi:hypothetical protein
LAAVPVGFDPASPEQLRLALPRCLEDQGDEDREDDERDDDDQQCLYALDLRIAESPDTRRAVCGWRC